MGYIVYQYAYKDAHMWDTEKYFYMHKWSGCILVGEGFESVRKTLYPWYKANRDYSNTQRTEKQEVIHKRAKDIWEEIAVDNKFTVISNPLLEADDILALKALEGYPIVTNDKDLLQLPEYCRITKIDGRRTRTNVHAHLPKSMWDIPLTPEKYLLTLCLYGDIADNIPRLIPKGKKAIIASRGIYEHPTPWDEALQIYGQSLLDNLFLAVLPNPYIFVNVPDIQEVFNMVAHGVWWDYVLHNEVKEYAI
jgi:hypothetical protein